MNDSKDIGPSRRMAAASAWANGGPGGGPGGGNGPVVAISGFAAIVSTHPLR
jgi:hypothetical protein